jgi:hypothetical protein
MKIAEAKGDYQAEIDRLEKMRTDRILHLEGMADRRKAIGIESLTEAGKQAKYETSAAMMKAEMASSSERAKIGASGVKATGSALMGAQQATDIAYAAADRTAEAAASGIRIGGLELGNTLQTAKGERSLLTLEYGQNIAEQQRKKKYLEDWGAAMVAISALGGAAGLASGFYNVASVYSNAGSGSGSLTGGTRDYW